MKRAFGICRSESDGSVKSVPVRAGDDVVSDVQAWTALISN